ncbi:PREDICTED: pyruvate kinase-like isoform X2 [Papilio polytes]|uniref:pyruvate kinase-like isoform X2 n=1 Tax=Papilio polytes TaxID=76194 RepID=UPI000675EE8C|nr:PREDICTED: pyruvate kinase-like isoform X2 [Papilio polytes]
MVWPTEFDTRLGEYDAMELPGQQLSAATAYSPLDHVLNLDIKLPAACQRLTGIIATIGKSSNDVEIMQRMMAAGMNIALLNLSFGSRDEHIEAIKNLRQAAKNYSVVVGKNFPLAIAARLPGRKIRTGNISDTYVEPVELISGESVRLTTDETYKDRCSSSIVYIDFLHFAEQLKKGDIILLDNETIQLKVEVISTTTLTCKIERGGMLGSNKDVFVPNVVLKMPTYSEKDKIYIEMAVHHQVANGVMITRQELGSDISPKKLVIAQKNMIARANKANVPVCLCAHLLSSMRFNKIPLRAELLDVANCILDGADALVLSAETAIGIGPVETISCMASACKEAEACVWTKNMFQDYVEKTPMPCDQSTAIAMSAVLAAYRSLAAAIVVVTSSGTAAFQVAKYRPRCPIIAVTRYATLARQMHLYRGVMPLIYEYTPESDWQAYLEQRINFCAKWAMQRGFVRVGDPIVIVCSWKQGSEFTNTMRIVYATADINVT